MFREARNILFTEDGKIYLPSNLILCAACYNSYQSFLLKSSVCVQCINQE